MKAVYLCSTMHEVTLMYITLSKYCEKHETKRCIIIIVIIITYLLLLSLLLLLF